MHNRPFPRPARGFTAIELLTVVAILAILVSLAASNFSDVMRRWRVQKAVHELRASVYLARSEAIRRGGRVVIEKNTRNCRQPLLSDQWNCGWFIFVDVDGNGRWKAGEPLISTIQTLDGVDISRRPGGNFMRFDRFGMLNGANIISFNFVPRDVGVAHPAARTLCVAAGGRIRVLEDRQLGCF